MRLCFPGSSFALLLAAIATANPRDVASANAKTNPAVAPPPERIGFQEQIAPLLTHYCTKCHGGDKPRAGVSLEVYKDETQARAAREVWERVLAMLDAGLMPPEGEPQPKAAEFGLLTGWIEATILRVECTAPQDPGRVTIRRLNRTEYNNTIRHLLGVVVRSADDFPSDDVGYGFDNIGDVLSLSPLLMEKYFDAAETIAREAIALPPPPEVKRAGADALAGGQPTDGARVLVSNGEVFVELETAQEGSYLFRVEAFAQQAGPEPARMGLRVGDGEAKAFDVRADKDSPEVYQTHVDLKTGKHRLAAAFLNDYYKPDDPDPAQRDRNLFVVAMELRGPLDVPPTEVPESHRRLFTCRHPERVHHDRACAERILRDFATRAYRRPASKAEVERLVGLAEAIREEGESFELGIQVAIQGVLVSPHFLFRIELDPESGNPPDARELNDYELATRLSYFLWSSMPDDELFHLAAQGKLREPGVLEAQVRRMLADPKSQALVENFAGQWLNLRNLETLRPDAGRFPGFNDQLRSDMRRETELFFAAVLRDDRSILEFLDAGYTFLNQRLAQHYGIEGVEGDDFRRVEIPGGTRGGVLTQASILTLTSNPTRTSPVKRGKWILENILGTPPPPPPPDVPELAEEGEAATASTLRARMEIHRSNPVCASCHAQMDALGFALENYDAIGAWRDRAGTFQIDASATLPDGQSFRGPAELKAVLKDKKGLFTRCLVEKMLTYALGRGLERPDQCSVDEIAAFVAEKDYRFSSLLLGVVRSDPFLKRRGAKEAGP